MEIKEQLLKQYPGLDGFLDELFSVLPGDMQSLLLHRDGAAQFLERLPETFLPETVLEVNGEKGENQRAWELSEVRTQIETARVQG
jgi:hypothetical protein